MTVQELQDLCNEIQCDCGKSHMVKLSYDRGVLIPRFSDDTCDGFKEKVMSFISTNAIFLNMPPLPW